MDKKIADLTRLVLRFVKDANRLTAPYYEPPQSESHLWAWLCGLVREAEGVLEDIPAL